MKKVGRITIIAVIILALGFTIIKSMEKPSASAGVWDGAMTIGNMEAKNHFIIYSDLMCPYCIAFENAILENEEEFLDYIEKNDILVEIRLSDFLYQYGMTQPLNSRLGAIATFCAKDKKLDYYNAAIKDLWQNYFMNNHTGNTSDIDINYWLKLGEEKLELGEDFRNCTNSQQSLDEVLAMTERTVKSKISGMPYFKFNRYTASGFNLDWGWDAVKAWFDAGLRS